MGQSVGIGTCRGVEWVLKSGTHSLIHSRTYVCIHELSKRANERARCAHNYLISCSRAASCVSACAAGANNWGTRGGRFPSRWRQLAGALPVGWSLHRLERKRATPCGRAALLESARASPPCNARAPNGSHGGRGGGRMAAAAAWVPSEPVPLRPPSGAHQCHTWISVPQCPSASRTSSPRHPPDARGFTQVSLPQVFFSPFDFTPGVHVQIERDLRWGAGVDASGIHPEMPAGVGAMFSKLEFITL